MPELNKANRQCADVDIRVLSTMKPFLFFDTANTTTAGISSSNVYATKKGQNAIGFADPVQGTMTIEAQILPFKAYSLFNDGTISAEGVQAKKVTVKATSATQIPVTLPANTTLVEGTLFVYESGDFGGTALTGTYADGTFTGTGFTEGKEYEVGYVVKHSSSSTARFIHINDKSLPKDYFITQSTVEKDENGVITPYVMTAYKAVIQRNLELSFSSEGDPMSITITFDLFSNKDGDFFTIMEDEATE